MTVRTMVIRDLKAITLADHKTCGGKASSLGELMHARFAVPPGFVITTKAYDQFCEQGSVPERLAKTIMDAFDQLGASLVAVRSSATVEDGHETSWAGQLDTFLNTDREHLLEHIAQCFRSLQSDRARAYGRGDVQFAKVAVVVQKMVQSDIAGVVFTANPVTGNHDEIVMEWTKGLGDRVVSGEITPETVTFKKGELGTVTHELRPLAELCMQIEVRFGHPCDIEWARDRGGEFYFLQCRPITTL